MRMGSRHAHAVFNREDLSELCRVLSKGPAPGGRFFSGPVRSHAGAGRASARVALPGRLRDCCYWPPNRKLMPAE